MRPEDLAQECLRILMTQPDAPFFVSIGVLGKGWPPGQLVGSDSRGRFYYYDARKLLACLFEYGVCKVIGSKDGPQIQIGSGDATLVTEQELRMIDDAWASRKS